MKRRIVAVLAAVALAATASVGMSTAASAEEPSGAAYVAIGDSLAAGTGNLPYVDPQCLRSGKAYPNVLADMLGGSVVSRACAGANTTQIAAQAGMLAQQGVLDESTMLVTVTAGANNVPWLAVLAACSSTGTPADCQAAMAAAGAAIATIPGGVAQVLGAVRTAAPNAHIVITGYPMLFGSFSGHCSIGAMPGAPVKFTPAQAADVNEGVANINLAVQLGVGAYQAQYAGQVGHPDMNVEFVDVVPDFAGHALCDSGDRWISGLVSGKKTSSKGFHPNVAGQQAYARIIAEELMP